MALPADTDADADVREAEGPPSPSPGQLRSHVCDYGSFPSRRGGTGPGRASLLGVLFLAPRREPAAGESPRQCCAVCLQTSHLTSLGRLSGLAFLPRSHEEQGGEISQDRSGVPEEGCGAWLSLCCGRDLPTLPLPPPPSRWPPSETVTQLSLAPSFSPAPARGLPFAVYALEQVHALEAWGAVTSPPGGGPRPGQGSWGSPATRVIWGPGGLTPPAPGSAPPWRPGSQDPCPAVQSLISSREEGQSLLSGQEPTLTPWLLDGAQPAWGDWGAP